MCVKHTFFPAHLEQNTASALRAPTEHFASRHLTTSSDFKTLKWKREHLSLTNERRIASMPSTVAVTPPCVPTSNATPVSTKQKRKLSAHSRIKKTEFWRLDSSENVMLLQTWGSKWVSTRACFKTWTSNSRRLSMSVTNFERWLTKSVFLQNRSGTNFPLQETSSRMRRCVRVCFTWHAMSFSRSRMNFPALFWKQASKVRHSTEIHLARYQLKRNSSPHLYLCRFTPAGTF